MKPGYLLAAAIPISIVSLFAFQQSRPAPAPSGHLADPFSAGWLLADTNNDGIVDFIPGKIAVPANAGATECAAAADLAARLGFGSTGFTPPVVVDAARDAGNGPRIWIGAAAAPKQFGAEVSRMAQRLGENEGGVFSLGDNLIVLGHDDSGLLAAAEAFASRAPFVWKVPGDRLTAITAAIPGSALSGVTYLKGKNGINRAILSTGSAVDQAALTAALAKLANIHQLVAINGTQEVVSTKDVPLAAAANVPAGGADAAAPDAEAGPQRLDLATLYTMRGLFRGTPRMPIPSNLDGQLYVPGGPEGIAMANLAARMGVETTGLTLPLAVPVTGAKPATVRTKSVIAGDSDLAKEAGRKLLEEDTAASSAETPLASGEGELRIVDKAFGRQSAVLVRGDEAGEAAAIGLLSDHLPNLWEPGKQFASLEEARYDLHRFFSLRSAAGQATAALYRLDKWTDEIKRANAPVHDVEARVFVEIADPGLNQTIRKQVESKLGVPVKVETGSLRAGTKCCTQGPALHYQEPGYHFQQASPTFQEDVVIPWEGTRLLTAVQKAAGKIHRGDAVTIDARVSEGPAVRKHLQKQLTDIIAKQGADPKQSHVAVICAYKPGVSWLMDEIAPQLKGKPVSSIKIEFKKNEDPSGMRVMYSPARWVHELYPVDEMLAKELNLPLANIELSQFDYAPKAPTYRVHAFDASGKEILSSELTVTTVQRPYNNVISSYEQVEVDTGWVRLSAGANTLLDERIKTDLEEFWEHYQSETLPKAFKVLMAQAHGEIRPEFAPPFDTLRLDIHLSEPDYNIGIDKERISSLEALQEDTFYSTENFINMLGDLEAGRAETYVGRIMPIVHPSEDGKDGHVHIEFYTKSAANPLVELKWTDAKGQKHEQKRDLWALAGAMQPRLIQARVEAGRPGPKSLTWLLPADFNEDQFEEWVKLEGQDQVERSVFPVEQAKGQLAWLNAFHAAGLYRNEISYPYLQSMGFEFEVPTPLTAKAESAAPRYYASIKIAPPGSKRPTISDFTPRRVQWDEPISPEENEGVLAELAKTPGVDVYWMGRSYLGKNLWAADVTLPTPAQIRSVAKETTLKATVVYSGRQHANEVSSTSHILKLGEQLTNDPPTRAMLKTVNVVLHPITNTDGAELSVQLAKITPDNMLHPGYHGALAADVSVGQQDTDPVYPESRTRRQLLEGWLPDAFLNPHGYPSHEWVQPFSEYSGWVTNRQAANNGRTWWIPRGWFTSLNYLRDEQHPYSPKLTYEIRDRIVEAERGVPGLIDLENRMNARYERFGQRWQPRNMQQPLVKGIRIYMSLKGSPARGAAGEGGGARGSGGVGGISPDITWDSGYTEAPDETAHGDYMKLMASAGLAFDRVHLEYLASGKLRIRRTEREQGGKITWRVERLRPNLPSTESEPPRPAAASEPPTGQQ